MGTFDENKYPKVTARVPKWLKDKLTIWSMVNDRSISKVIRTAIEKYLEGK